MDTDDDQPQQTSVDRLADRPVKTQTPPVERPSKQSQTGDPIIGKSTVSSEKDTLKKPLFSISEVERKLADNTLKVPTKKFDTFITGIARKQDLRLRTLSRQIKPILKREFNNEIKSGPESNRVRNFDIQSQTLRMATANAALGTYQFQKSITLPYMRKSLALDYQKLNVLKDISAGIKSLQDTTIAKLEAIKINTAAAVPKKKGFIGKLMTAVADKNRDRIAANISNYISKQREELYDKFVRSRILRANKTLSDQSKTGGINGLRQGLFNSINSVRRTVNKVANETDTSTVLGRMKSNSAKLASKVLTTGAVLTNKAKLSETKNRYFSDKLSGLTKTLDNFNPFSDPLRKNFDEIEKKETDHHDQEMQPLARLANGFDEWRKDYKTNSDKMFDEVSSISKKMEECCHNYKDETKAGKSSSKRKTKKKEGPVPEIKPVSEPRKKTTTEQIVEQVEQPKTKRTRRKSPAPVAIETPPTDVPHRQVTTIGGLLKSARDRQQASGKYISQLANKTKESFSTLTTSFRDQLPLTLPKSSLQANAHVEAFKQHQKETNPTTDRTYFAKLFTTLNNRLGNLNKSVDAGNAARSRFEGLQTKWNNLKDTLLKRKSRANSSEDQLEHRRQLDENKPGLIKRNAQKIGASLGKAYGRYQSGNVLGAGLGLALDASLFTTKKAFKYGGKAIGKTLKFGVTKAVPAAFNFTRTNVIPTATSLTGELISAGAGALGAGAGMLGRGLLAGGKFLLPRAAGLAKFSLPSLAVGLAADGAESWLNKNTTGTTKRLGTTAAEAAKYGTIGATIGSVIPGIGTLLGGGIGAGVGAIIANSDVLGSALNKAALAVESGVGYFSNSVYGVGKSLWTNIFGQKADVDKWGRVKQKQEQSLFGNISSAFFGRDAKYTKSGEVMMSGRDGIISELSKATASVFDTIKSIIGNLPTGVKDAASSTLSFVGDLGSGKALTDFGSAIYNAVGGAADAAASMFGKNQVRDKAEIENYLGAGGKNNVVDPSVTAWCAAFVNASLARAGIRGTGSLTASSFKNWGVAISPSQVQKGDVLIEDKGVAAGQPGDHVGIATGQTRIGRNGSLQIEMISGNSGKRVEKVFYDASRLLVRRQSQTPGDDKPSVASQAQNPWIAALVPQQQSTASGLTAPINPFGPQSNPFLSQYSPNGSGSTPLSADFYNRSPLFIQGNTSGQSGTASGRFADAVNYLSNKKGWSRIGAVGIAANLFGESSLNPSAVNPKSGARGLAQWLGPRIREIESRSGKPITSMSFYEQLDAIDAELRTNRNITNSNQIPNGSTPIVEAINRADRMESVIQQMVYRYERPGNMAQEVERRIATAYGILNHIGNDKPKANPPAPAATSSSRPSAKQPPKQTPKSQSTPAQQSQSLASEWTTALNKFSDTITTNFTNKPKQQNHPAGNAVSIINAPTVVHDKAKPATTMSMDKTNVRTGG